jgi:RNA polymerase sigma factor (sigma-70 family)
MGREPAADDFEAVFAVLYPRARTVALRILGSVPDAEDAAAEALARALADWSRVSALDYRDAWVLRVTANVAIDAARRRGRSVASSPSTGPDEDDVSVLRLTLVSALTALPRRQREALVLRHMAGFPEDDVARAMGVSHNTAKKHLQRGLGRLRSAFGSDEAVAVAFK